MGSGSRRPVGRVAVESEAVDLRPLLLDLGVDDDPAVLVGRAFEADAELATRRAGATIGRDDVLSADSGDVVVSRVQHSELDALGILRLSHALAAKPHRDVGEPLDA